MFCAILNFELKLQMHNT